MILGPSESEADYPHQVGLAGHGMPGAPVHPSCDHLDEYLVDGDVRPVDLYLA
jgi:hypothetical protein